MADWVAELRRELTLRAITYAQRNKLPHFLSKGGTVFFEPYLDASGVARHGNFFAPSYEVIRHDPDLAGMLCKTVVNPNTIPRLKQGMAMETDSSCSTTALLMNIFCLPEARALAPVFGVDSLDFSFENRCNSRRKKDRASEPDLVLSDNKTFLWAVLAEGMTGVATIAELEQIPDLQRHVAVERLSVSGGMVRHADILKLFFAARQKNARFVFLVDERRNDLLKGYRRVMQAVREPNMAHLITWQEIAAALPLAPRAFVEEKYGIACTQKSGQGATPLALVE